MKFKTLVKNFISNKFLVNQFKGFRFIFLFHDISDSHENHFSKHYSTKIKDFIKFSSLDISAANLSSI